jgi:AcrR family transcriptional regulator
MKPLSAEQQKVILDGAVQLFASHNLKDISLDQLSRVSGISAFDIVRHYQSRENILKSVLERELELMAAAAHAPELRMPGETLNDELHVLAGVILQEHRSRLPFLRKLMVEAMDNKDVATLFYSTFIVQGRRLFTEFLDERKRLGELRQDLDVEAAAALFLVCISGALWMAEFYGGKYVETMEDEVVLDRICTLFLDGARAR